MVMAKVKKPKSVTVILEEKPNWLLFPVTSVPTSFPVQSNKQDLPYGELTWENYERLCFRLAGGEAEVEHWALYGRQGQSQEGIDIFSRKAGSAKYTCWQAKKRKAVTANEVKTIVTTFLKGDWAKKTDRFCVCFQATIQDTKVQGEIEAQTAVLKAHGIAFIPIGSVEMSERLKHRTDLVLDFFGRHWADAFCGPEAVACLGDRLDGLDIVKLRAELLAIYSGHFQVVDPGVGSIPLAGPRQSLPLLQRFIEPDIAHRENLASVKPEKAVSESANERRDAIPESPQTQSSSRSSSATAIRRPLSNWASEGSQLAVIAPGGFGKSSFLRALALSLLSEGDLFPSLTRRWSDRIPIYLPFATWTRLFSDDSGDVSLADAITHWFKRFSPSVELLRLIIGSLKDNRLLLLIDGLDEGTNPAASRSALTLLDSFIKTYGIDAVLTSRPSGIDRLGALDPMWRTGRIAELTKDQQRRLALIWYRHLKSSNSVATKANQNSTEYVIEREVDDFFTTLSGRGMLEPLAGIPLLLTGLIALVLKHVSLPRSRFEAYDELVKLLLDEHPKRRASAAQQGKARSVVLSDPELVRGALSYLAYKCRETGATPSILVAEAKKFLVEYLQSMEGAGLPAAAAISAANELLAIDAETTGLLVQRSPDEIGFLHMLFEEHLAGCYAATFPLDDQKTLMVEKSGDERWLNVLLAMLRGIKRRNEVEILVKSACEAATDPVTQVLTRRLATEVAFGDFSCPPQYAQEIAREAFDVIETGGWMPERAELLSIALEASWNASVSPLLKERVGQWFPESIPHRQYVYSGLTAWPRDEELKLCLWRGLFCDDIANKRAAAIALVHAFRGDVEIGDRLATQVCAAADAETASVALLALQNGWSKHARLITLTDQAKRSGSIPVLLIGIRCSIAQKTHTDADLDVLLDIAKDRRGFNEWAGDLIPALIEGWPNNERIYKLVVETIHTAMHNGPLDKDVAKSYALHAAQFDDVKDAEVAEAIRQDEFFLRSMGRNHLKVGDYRKNVLAAVDYRIEKTNEYFHNDVAEMAVVVKTPAAKARLIRDLQDKDHWIFWPVWGLLEGWGMSDPEVSGALTPLLAKPPSEQNLFAHYIPDIEQDHAKAKQHLIEIAKEAKLERLDMLVRGFRKAGVDYTDNETVELLLKHSFGQRGVFDATDDLIGGFGLHPKVRELARERLKEVDCPWHSLVEAYGNDPEFREVIFSRLNSLPASLRGGFVSAAAMKSTDEVYLECISQWPAETDAEIQVQASVAYNTAIKLDQEKVEPAIDYLKREGTSIGPWMDQRRQAALAGLIALGREEVFANLEPDHGQKPIKIGLYYPENRAAIAYLARNWEGLLKAFSGQIVDRLSMHGSSEWHTWQFFAPYISESPAARDAFISYCGRETKSLSSQALEALSRVLPRSALLQEHCERIVSRAPTDINSTPLDVERCKIIVGQIIGRQFQSHSGLLVELEKRIAWGDTAGVVGLYVGWPQSPLLKECLDRALAAKWKNHSFSFVAALHLAGIAGTTEQFKEVFSMLLERSDGSPWSFLEHCVTPTVDRLKRDPILVRDSLKVIEKDNANFKASMPRLLSSAIGLTDELRALCNKQLLAEHSGKSIPLSGLDIVAGKVRTVSDALMDTLISTGA
jgi:hypothetical protein